MKARHGQDRDRPHQASSRADTGYFYVKKKNPRAKTEGKKTAKAKSEKLELMKYDPVVRKHVAFRESKIK